MSNPRKVLSVSELTQQIKSTLNGTFSQVAVTGEIANFTRAHSGHFYFTIKDSHSQISAIMWESWQYSLKFEPKNGHEVICTGNIDVYGPRGTYQLSVRSMEPKGIGSLQLAFKQLHAKLKAKGYFDPEKKKPLPKFPRRIAVVTSPSGAAIRDFLQVAMRRWPSLDVTVIPCRVQGEGAAFQIARGIRAAHHLKPQPDAIVVGRGGGSAEDLWCFNEEPVVEAIYKSGIPIVSSIGHEIDVTLADLAADKRALTPTEAAEIVFQERMEIENNLNVTQQRMQQAITAKLESLRERLDSISSRPVLAQPQYKTQQLSQRIDELQFRMQAAMDQQVQNKKSSIRQFAAQLQSLSPLNVLSRGYSITSKPETGELIRSADQVGDGDQIEVAFHDSKLLAKVEKPVQD